MNAPTHYYVGRCATCQSTVAVVYDSEYLQDVALGVANMIRRGLKVQRLPVNVEKVGKGCMCHRRDRMADLPLFEGVK